MKMKDLCDMIAAGRQPIVEFLPGSNSDDCISESCMDPGMRARVKSIRDLYGDGTVNVVSFDQTDFEAFNEPFAAANYYDEKGTPCLTAKQKGRWNLVEEIYMSGDGDFDISGMLKLVEEGDAAKSQELFRKYRESGHPGTYVDWLERQILALNDKQGA